MSSLIQEFSGAVTAPDGRAYTARVRGEQDEAGRWQGWLEFLPLEGGPALQTGRETTQSSRDQLEYWATGLSMSYLEMAIRRARGTALGTPPPPPPLEPPPFDAERIRDDHEDSTVVRLEVETLDPSLALRLVPTPDLRLWVGRSRAVPGGGILVYDGAHAEEGRPSRHAFLVQYGSENAAAVLANHLWSALHGEGAMLRVEGELVHLDNHSLYEALRRRLPVHRRA